MFGPKKMLGEKKLRETKCLVQKKFWFKKFVGFKHILGPQKNQSKNICFQKKFGSKKFNVQKFLCPTFFGLNKFWVSTNLDFVLKKIWVPQFFLVCYTPLTPSTHFLKTFKTPLRHLQNTFQTPSGHHSDTTIPTPMTNCIPF